MSRVVVSTSTSCLDYLTIPHNVRMLRVHVYIDGQDYLDGKDITNYQLSDMMATNPKLFPKTGAVTEEEIIEFLQQLVDEGIEEVLIVCVSSWMSATYQRIKDLISLFYNKLVIHLYDTRHVAHVESVLVLEASKMLEQGQSIPTIIRQLDTIRDNATVLFALDDLNNLIKNKRLSAPAGFIANLFNIKPILFINEKGEITPIERIRHIQNAIDRMCDTIVTEANGNNSYIYVHSTTDNDLTEYMKNRLAMAGIHNPPMYPVGCVSTAIMGSRGLGIGLIKNYIPSF